MPHSFSWSLVVTSNISGMFINDVSSILHIWSLCASVNIAQGSSVVFAKLSVLLFLNATTHEDVETLPHLDALRGWNWAGLVISRIGQLIIVTGTSDK